MKYLSRKREPEGTRREVEKGPLGGGMQLWHFDLLSPLPRSRSSPASPSYWLAEGQSHLEP